MSHIFESDEGMFRFVSGKGVAVSPDFISEGDIDDELLESRITKTR
ncbi:MAG: hypothetical protein GXP06_15130 [Alphaproteobacteria bacterium]|nr:hypothetical protein [Alphaproteobacteria bacterium]